MRRHLLIGLLVLGVVGCASSRGRRGDTLPADSGPAPDASGDGAAGDGGPRDAGGGPTDAASDGPTSDASTAPDAGPDGGLVADAGRDAGMAFDAGHDSGVGLDAGRDAGIAFDAGRDAGGAPDAGRFDGGVSVTFPTMAATTCYSTGTCMPLGAGGGGVHYVSGDYLEETVTFGAPSISGLSLMFDMDDMTVGCAGVVGAINTFDVLVNGTRVGGYSFVTSTTGTGTGRLTVSQSYTFGSITGTGGTQYTIRLQATSTVCPGGSSWNWFPGGTAVGRSP